MVYGIVHNHSGAIALETKEGEGSCFQLYFPALPSKSLQTFENEKFSDETNLFATLNGKTVLVAEDEEVLRNMYQEMLSSCGAKILFAHDGEEAVQVYREHLDRRL